MALLLSYRTAASFGEGRFEEKKSVFIGSVKPCETMEEAHAFIGSVKEKYPDANHHVWAFLNREGNVVRFDDDGEPKGTGGVPVLEVLKKEGLTGLCVVVTRYFGGILLGAGGLARAYARGARVALENSGTALFSRREVLSFSLPYSAFAKAEYECAKRAIPVLSKVFTDRVSCEVLCDGAAKAFLVDFLSETTQGAEAPAFVRYEFAKE